MLDERPTVNRPIVRDISILKLQLSYRIRVSDNLARVTAAVLLSSLIKIQCWQGHQISSFTANRWKTPIKIEHVKRIRVPGAAATAGPMFWQTMVYLPTSGGTERPPLWIHSYVLGDQARGKVCLRVQLHCSKT